MQFPQAIFSIKPNLLAIACSWLACLAITTSPVSAQQYPGVKCIVDGNLQCKVQHSVKFERGKVFFGNQTGVEYFQKKVLDKIKRGQQPEQSLVLKANHQLALTKQVQQQRCPVSGKSIQKEHELAIAGVRIFFHDSAAKKELQAAKSTWHRAQQVFASDAFSKNFVRAKQAPEEPITVADGSTKLPPKKVVK